MSPEQLARWAPGMMRAVATALVRQVQQKEIMARKLSWDEHVRNGHVPFRRDGGVCQRAAARSRPHRRQDFPEGFTLSFDTAGPFKEGKDLDNKKKKYLLCAAYTWPVLTSTEGDEGDPDSLTFAGPAIREDLYGDDDFEYEPSVAPEHEGPMDLDPEEATAIQMALDEIIEESGDYDVVDVSEVIPSRVGEPPLPASPGPVLPVAAEAEGEEGSHVEADIRENIRRAEAELAERLPRRGDAAGSAEATTSEEVQATLDSQVSEESRGSDEPDPNGGDPGAEELKGRFMTKEEYKVRTIIQAVPMKSKKSHDVLAAMQELYLRFLRYGYPVYRIHTDSGKEFVNQKTKQWAANRSLVFTRSCPDEHQQNGRAEAAIGSLKSRIRRLLHAAKMEPTLWPVAVRHVVELERRRVEGEMEKLPRFGQKVVSRRRGWVRGGDFEPTAEDVIYLTPVPDVVKGHAVMTLDGKYKVASCIWKDLKEQAEDSRWVGDEVGGEDHDAHAPRRRIREKTSMASMKVLEAEPNLAEQIRLQNLLYHEEGALRTEAPQNRLAVTEGMISISQEQVARATREDEDEVLQTRVMSNMEIWYDSEAWKPATQKEIDSLVEKGAIRRLKPDQVAELKRNFQGRIEQVPGKAVYTVKAPDGKKKCRLVVCGNFLDPRSGVVTNTAEQQAKRGKDPDLYAGGADSIALRAALAIASQRSWMMASLDVKTAFLNAELGEGARPAEGPTEERLVLMLPPKILIRLGLVEEGELWAVDKALYSFRESPRCWAAHRDAAMREMKE